MQFKFSLSFVVLLVCLTSAAQETKGVTDLLPDITFSTDLMDENSLDANVRPGRVKFRFSSLLPNIGSGDFRLISTGVDVGNNRQTVVQVIRRSDGSTRERAAGDFLYNTATLHMESTGWTSYRIREVLEGDGVGPILRFRGKFAVNITSSTLVDNSLPNFGMYPRIGGHGPNQGISVGYGDIYSRNLEFQWVDVTGLPSGDYWLEIEVDPGNNVLEENEYDNTARLKVFIDMYELGERDLCQEFNLIDDQDAPFKSAFEISTGDLDADGLSDAASFALMEAVVCSGPEDALFDATQLAFNDNLGAFDLDLDAGSVYDYRELLSAFFAMGQGTQDALIALLELEYIFLTGSYEIVSCATTEDCSPSVKGVLGEPYSAAGDLDGDGFTNLEEYEYIVTTNGGTLADFVAAARDPETGGPPATDLLPDLTFDGSESEDNDINMDRRPGRVLFRFRSSLPNIGSGEFRIVANMVDSGDGREIVEQVIMLSDGSTRLRRAGDFLFNPANGHMENPTWTSYRIREVLAEDGIGQILRIGGKFSVNIASSTVFDNTLPNFGVYDVLGGSGRVQGISVGYTDIYMKNLPLQWVDVTGLPSGEYWVELEVDPGDSILEEDETNNVGRLKVFIEIPELDERDLCEAFTVIEEQQEPFMTALNVVSEDLDGDGLPDAASLALLEAVACLEAGGAITDAAQLAFNNNLAAFDADLDAQLIYDYREFVAALLVVGQNTQVALLELLDAENVVLTGDYDSVFCTSLEDCAPSVKGDDLGEVFGGDGDLDDDGSSNALEYERVVTTHGGTLEEFVEIAMDPTRDGTGPRAPTVTIEQGQGQEDPAPLPVVFDVVFSEDVTGFDDVVDDLFFEGTATEPVAIITATDGANYTVEITAVAELGTLIVSIVEGAAIDIDEMPSEASTSADNSVTVVAQMADCHSSAGPGGARAGSGGDLLVTLLAMSVLIARRPSRYRRNLFHNSDLN